MATKRKTASKARAKPRNNSPAVATPDRMTKGQKAEQARWNAQSDLRNLEQAQAIRDDPARLKAVQTEARRMAKVAGVVAKAER